MELPLAALKTKVVDVDVPVSGVTVGEPAMVAAAVSTQRFVHSGLAEMVKDVVATIEHA